MFYKIFADRSRHWGKPRRQAAFRSQVLLGTTDRVRIFSGRICNESVNDQNVAVKDKKCGLGGIEI
jgi:hypothetical protein